MCFVPIAKQDDRLSNLCFINCSIEPFEEWHEGDLILPATWTAGVDCISIAVSSKWSHQPLPWQDDKWWHIHAICIHACCDSDLLFGALGLLHHMFYALLCPSLHPMQSLSHPHWWCGWDLSMLHLCLVLIGYLFLPLWTIFQCQLLWYLHLLGSSLMALSCVVLDADPEISSSTHVLHETCHLVSSNHLCIESSQSHPETHPLSTHITCGCNGWCSQQSTVPLHLWRVYLVQMLYIQLLLLQWA